MTSSPATPHLASATAKTTAKTTAKLSDDRRHYAIAAISGVEFGLPLAQIRELFLLPAITPGAGESPAALGTIDLHGTVREVFDLGVWLLGERQPLTAATQAAWLEVADQAIVLVLGEIRSLRSLDVKAISALSHASLRQDWLNPEASNGTSPTSAEANHTSNTASNGQATAAPDPESPSAIAPAEPSPTQSLNPSLLAGVARTESGPLPLVSGWALIQRAERESHQDSDRPPLLVHDLPTSSGITDLLNARADRLRQTMADEAALAGMATARQAIIVFAWQDEWFGIELAPVREVIELERLTPVPGVGLPLVGLFNRRGDILPLVDLRVLVGLPARASVEPGSKQAAIVVDLAPWGLLAIAVDQLIDLLPLDPEALLSRSTTTDERSGTLGELRCHNRATIWLDPAALLAQSGLAH